MSQLLHLLLEALNSGDVTLSAGQILGRCGYTDWVNRTVVLNPEASPEQLEAQLRHALELLVPVPMQRHGDEPGRPSLRLLPTGDQVDDEAGYWSASGE